MDNNPTFELSKYRIERAKEDLRAVFVYEKFDSRKHSGIISHFNKRYIKEGIFDREYSKILMGAEKIRSKSD